MLAYHDRSDGGLITTLCEMAFAGRCGLDLIFDAALGHEAGKLRARLFSEEPGAVIQIAESQMRSVLTCFENHHLEHLVSDIGQAVSGQTLSIKVGDTGCLQVNLANLHQVWSETSYEIQKLRDHPDCAEEEYAGTLKWDQPFLKPN